MPIYEFYCRDCHRIYNFLARRLNVQTTPACPKCGRAKLERRLSTFAIGRRRESSSGDEPTDHGDDPAIESLLAELEHEADRIDENDPRQMGRLMRRIYEKTGMPLDGPLAEALRRLEAGEDPDRIEEEMGDVFDQLDEGESDEAPSDAITGPTGSRRGGLRSALRRIKPPEVDDGLYDLE